MMMALGFFVFQLKTAAYQDFKRQTQWRHPASSRVNATPARQFTGKGDDAITLSGHIAPELTGSALSLDALRLMADTGKAWPLIEGSGRIYGVFVIESLNEDKSLFFKDGAARKINFTLQLKRVDESVLDALGDIITDGIDILGNI